VTAEALLPFYLSSLTSVMIAELIAKFAIGLRLDSYWYLLSFAAWFIYGVTVTFLVVCLRSAIAKRASRSEVVTVGLIAGFASTAVLLAGPSLFVTALRLID
jgi:hypothetical protein